MELSNVSRTAVYTLLIHEIMAKKKITIDQEAINCATKMMQIAALLLFKGR
jgi:hypothetical protein